MWFNVYMSFLTFNPKWSKKKSKRQQKGKLLPSQMSECHTWCDNMQILPSATAIFPPSLILSWHSCVVCHLFHYHRLCVCVCGYAMHVMSVLCRLYFRMCVVYSCERRGFNELQESVPLSISVYRTPHWLRGPAHHRRRKQPPFPTSIFSITFATHPHLSAHNN